MSRTEKISFIQYVSERGGLSLLTGTPLVVKKQRLALVWACYYITNVVVIMVVVNHLQSTTTTFSFISFRLVLCESLWLRLTVGLVF